MKLSYAVITPARDEAENLPRLARALTSQSILPRRWIIVDSGSTDDTYAVAEEIAASHSWIDLKKIDGPERPVRGEDARAFLTGVLSLEEEPDVVAKVDADVSMEADYFERLLAAFAADLTLGIASGGGYELEDSLWRVRNVTGSSVRGPARAYRWGCLQDVLPLEARVGWDGVDEMKANARGWRTRTIRDLPFWHHRREGAREKSRRVMQAGEGRSAHYMGYRPLYLLLRALHRARHDPAALAMIWGYSSAALRGEPRLADADARAYLRNQQRLRHLRDRMREASRPREVLSPPDEVELSETSVSQAR